MHIEPITFDRIYPIWTDLLWGYDAKPSSCMVYGDRNLYDMTIFNNPVTYFAAFHNGEILGVNSGFKTDTKYYRSRGLWVFPEHRGKGVADLLLNEVIRQAFDQHITYVWSFARKQAIKAYLRVGFEQTSDWIYETDGDRYNAYVLRRV